MRKLGSDASRGLGAICFASLCWAFSFGAGAPLAALWLRDHGYSTTYIGLNTGTYYFGIVLAAGLVPWLLRRGRWLCPFLGMILSCGAVGLFPHGSSLAAWYTLSLFNGIGGALALIALETLVNERAAEQHRSRDFGFYAFSVALGIALGTFFGLQLYPTMPGIAFRLGAAAPLIGALIIMFLLPWPERTEQPSLTSDAPLALGRVFFSLGSAWSQGFLEGGMMALVPLYLLGIGLSEEEVGWLMSGTMIGVIAFQVPVAWLADRLGRTRVLLGCYGATLLGLALMPFCTQFPSLAVCFFIAGASSAAFYPLGLALLGERLPVSSMAKANSWYLGFNCVGSLTGPIVSGLAMDRFGPRALFAAGEAAVAVVLITWLASRFISRRRSKPSHANSHVEVLPCEQAA